MAIVLLFLSLTGIAWGDAGGDSVSLKNDTRPMAAQRAQIRNDLVEDFQGGVLASDQWQITRHNDFNRSEIDVVKSAEGGFRLRLLADTMGTDDDTVKFHGVRTTKPFDFTEGKVISFALDWNAQQNGSYLTAGIFLAPVATDENPRSGREWLALEYVGVPPGGNIRLQVAKKRNGSLGFLFTEGWPEQQRNGRRINGPQHLQLVIDKERLAVSENNNELFSVAEHGLGFTRGYLYLQMSSHSNYPAREIYFDDIHIGP